MSRGFQEVNIIGNLGADPAEKLRTVSTRNGEQSVLTVGIAVQDGQEHTEWFDCTFWGPLAETLTQYAGKGSKVFVKGAKRTTEKQTEQGTRKFVEYVVSEMNILTYRGDDTPAPSAPAQAPKARPNTNNAPRQGQAPAPRQQGRGFAQPQPRKAPTPARRAPQPQYEAEYDPGVALGFDPEDDFQE